MRRLAASEIGEVVPVRQLRSRLRVGQTWRHRREGTLMCVEHIHRADRQVRGTTLVLKHSDMEILEEVKLGFREMSENWRLLDNSTDDPS